MRFGTPDHHTAYYDRHWVFRRLCPGPRSKIIIIITIICLLAPPAADRPPRRHTTTTRRKPSCPPRPHPLIVVLRQRQLAARRRCCATTAGCPASGERSIKAAGTRPQTAAQLIEVSLPAGDDDNGSDDDSSDDGDGTYARRFDEVVLELKKKKKVLLPHTTTGSHQFKQSGRPVRTRDTTMRASSRTCSAGVAPAAAARGAVMKSSAKAKCKRAAQNSRSRVAFRRR